MAPSKSKRQSTHTPPHQHIAALVDADERGADAPQYGRDPPGQAVAARTNDDLNLSVLRRHNPLIRRILSIATYAVIYTFSATAQTWEKTGCEGSLFVSELSDDEHDRYVVIVLNRRGLENFELELFNEDDVELTDDYVILQREEIDPDAKNGSERPEPIVYGVWIYAEADSSTEHMRTNNAAVIQECAARAQASQQQSESQTIPSTSITGSLGNANSDFPLGRQLSLREIFGQSEHGALEMSARQPGSQPSGAAAGSLQFPHPSQWQMPSVATDSHPTKPQLSQGQDALLDLFKRAKQDYRANV